jgi:hypothetical protein
VVDPTGIRRSNKQPTPTQEETMKRRFFALLAIPALALGFALASPGTDQAQAYPQVPYGWVCSYLDMKMGEAEHYGDWASYDYWADLAERGGCTPF